MPVEAGPSAASVKKSGGGNRRDDGAGARAGRHSGSLSRMLNRHYFRPHHTASAVAAASSPTVGARLLSESRRGCIRTLMNDALALNPTSLNHAALRTALARSPCGLRRPDAAGAASMRRCRSAVHVPRGGIGWRRRPDAASSSVRRRHDPPRARRAPAVDVLRRWALVTIRG